MNLSGASVLITGGKSGIGLEIAKRCLHLGARVTAVGRSARPIPSECLASGDLRLVTGDVTSGTDRKRMVDIAVQHGGGLDALLHCAGKLVLGPSAGLRESDAVEVFDTNLLAPLMLSVQALPHMLESRSASIVFFSSSHAARTFTGTVAYAASKAGTERTSMALAGEWGQLGIRVNCVRPGSVPSPFLRDSGLSEQQVERRVEGSVKRQALRAVGTVGDVAGAALYLLEADWVTGSVLTVDGGVTLGL